MSAPAENPNPPQPAPATDSAVATAPATRKPWLWNVVLLDDNQHTFDYVIRMLTELFGHSAEQARRTAETIDSTGRGICMTTHREHAELKCEQIHGFGADPMAAESTGPMKSVLEPAAADA
jgi:ATP-dependent Clp protease adaptor protein ClpS